jgi:hypothetical protein
MGEAAAARPRTTNAAVCAAATGLAAGSIPGRGVAQPLLLAACAGGAPWWGGRWAGVGGRACCTPAKTALTAPLAGRGPLKRLFPVRFSALSSQRGRAGPGTASGACAEKLRPLPLVRSDERALEYPT